MYFNNILKNIFKKLLYKATQGGFFIAD